MIYQVFAVYDSKAGAYSVPFYQSTTSMALRAFAEAANMPDHPLGKHPEDYSLFYLGEWDDTKGEHRASAPKNLGLAANFKKEENSSVRKIA